METKILLFKTVDGEALYELANGELSCTNIKKCIEAVKKDVNHPVFGRDARYLYLALMGMTMTKNS